MKRPTRMWLISAAVALVLVAVNAVLYTRVVRPWFVRQGIGLPGRNFVMEGPSMAPTLPAGTRLVIDPSQTPARGDVIVFEQPGGQKRLLIKRVIAVGGDRVEVRKGVVYLNGQPLEEPYIQARSVDSLAEHAVASGSVWALGDNRGQSLDSRHFGDIPLANVRGVMMKP